MERQVDGGAAQSPEDPHAGPGGSPTFELLAKVTERLPAILGVSIAAALLAFGGTFLMAPTFTARVVILPPQQGGNASVAALQNLGTLASLAGIGGGVRNTGEQLLTMTQSATVETRLVERFGLQEAYDEEYVSKAREELRRRTRTTLGRKDGLLSIEVDDEDPGRAAEMANAYVQELRKLTDTLALTEAQHRRAFFEKHLKQARQDMAVAQRALQEGGFSEGAIRAEPKAAAETYARLRAEVTAARVRLQSMRGYLADGSPEIVLAQGQLASLTRELERLESLNARAGAGDYMDRYRNFKYQESLFELFSRQFELARVDESREGALIQVVDAAAVPDRKSKPRRGLIGAATGLVAFLLGLAMVTWSARREAGGEPGLGGLSQLAKILLSALRRGFGLR